MAPGRLLQRNVRPQRLATEDDEDFIDDIESEEDDRTRDGEADADTDEEHLDTAEQEEEDDDNDNEDTANDSAELSEEVEQEADDNHLQQQLSSVSFGVLKQAQDALSRKRKRDSDTTPNHDEKLAALRLRLRELKKSQPPAASTTTRTKPSHSSRSTQPHAAADRNSDSDSDSAPSESAFPSSHRPPARSSKHAPTQQSSKHQVTRRRAAVAVPTIPKLGDPRFTRAHQHQTHSSQSVVPAAHTEQAYGFLAEYRKDELAALREAAAVARKKTKQNKGGNAGVGNEEEQARLARMVDSVANRVRADENAAREREVVRRWREEERARVKEGKKPFFLKRGEVKRRVLVERWEGMKGKERTKAVERRRKKEGQKEKKRMPVDRRVRAEE